MKYTRDLEHKCSGLEAQLAQLRERLSQSEDEKRLEGEHSHKLCLAHDLSSVKVRLMA
jgi:hypothetical protein